MTEPIDPNTGWTPPVPPAYQPPPPFLPPAADHGPIAPHVGPGYPTGYPPPWPGTFTPPPPPPKRRRTVLLVSLLAAVLAAAALVGFVAVHGSGSGSPSLSLPTSFDGYTRVTGQQGEQFESSMSAFTGSFANGALDRATIGGYTHELGETPALVVFILPSPALPSSAPAKNGGLAASLRAIAGPSMRDYPAGPHGGELLCGSFSFGTMHEPMCVWTDSSVTGVMVSIESVTPRHLSEVAVDLRGLVH